MCDGRHCCPERLPDALPSLLCRHSHERVIFNLAFTSYVASSDTTLVRDPFSPAIISEECIPLLQSVLVRVRTFRSYCEKTMSKMIFFQSFSPTSGPLKGGTTLVISGTDMGTKAKDIQEVLVAGERCDIVRSEYSVSVRSVVLMSAALLLHLSLATCPRQLGMIFCRVVCITNPASTVKSGHVSVKIRNVTRHSQAEFKYRSVTV